MRRGLAVLLLVLLLPPLLLLLALETGPGQRFAAERLTRILTAQEGGIAIDGIGGSLWNRLTASRVAIGDAAGDWLILEGVVLDWRPLALLSGELSIALLEAAEIRLLRLPLAVPERAPAPEEAPLLPDLPALPLDIGIERLALGKVSLSAPLLGLPAAFGLRAKAQWPRGGAPAVTLGVAGKDGTRLELDADMHWAPAAGILTLDLALSEPQGGLIARLAALPALPSIDLTLAGAGPLSDWKGDLLLALNGTEAIAASLNLAGAPKRRIALSGRIDPGGSLPPDLLPTEARPWLEGGASLELAAELDGSLLSLQRLRLEAGAFALKLAGELDSATEQLRAALDLTLPVDSPLRAAVPGVALGALSLRAEAEGDLALPKLRLTAAVGGVRTAGAEIGGLDLVLEAAPDAAGLATALEVRLQRPKVLLPEVPPLPYGDLRLTAAALVDPGAGSALVQSLALRGEGLDLEVEGAIALPALRGRPSLQLSARLPDLGQIEPLLAGLPLALTLDGGVALEGLAQPIEAKLAATITGTGGLPDGIGALLGDGLSLAGGAAYAPDGSIALERVSLLGRTLALELDGRIDPGEQDSGEQDSGGIGSGEIALAWQLAVDDLTPASAAIGSPAGGSLTAEGTFGLDAGLGAGRAMAVAASLDGRGLTMAGQEIGSLTGKIELAGALPDLSGRIELEAPDSGYGPLSLTAGVASAGVTSAGSGAVRIAPLTLALGGELQIAGAVTVPAAGGPLSGQVTGSLDGGPLLTDLLGVTLQGGGDLVVDLTGDPIGDLAVGGGRQDAAAKLTLAPGTLAGIAHRGMVLQAAVQDAGGARRMTGRLDGQGLAAGPAQLSTLAATFAGTPEALTVTAETAGNFGGGTSGGPLHLALAGQLRPSAGGIEIALSRLEGEAKGFPFAQTRRTEIAVGPEGAERAVLGLAAAGATLDFEALPSGSGKRVDLALRDFDLAQLQPFVEGRPQGRIDARLALRGDRRALGELTLTASQVSVQEEGFPANPPIDIAVEGALTGAGLVLDGRLSGSFGQPMRLSAKLPLRLSLAEPAAVLSRTAPIEAALEWSGALGPLIDLAPVGEQRITGQGSIDLAVAGSLEEPQIGGSLRIDKGRYENLLTATVVQDLTLVLEGSNRGLVIREASGNDGEQGRIGLTGGIDLAGGAPSLQIDLKAEDFALLRRDDLYARMDLALSAAGELSQAIAVTGSIVNREIRASIQPDLPPGAAELEVELRRGGRVIGAKPAAGEEDTALPVILDIAVDLPRRVYVEGLGLASEWGGKLLVRGTAGRPLIAGSLSPRRGFFSIFGRQFDLEAAGSVAFDGADGLDPALDVAAVYEADELTATVAIAGRASAPTVALTSDPAMPQEEILSEVLFGRGTGQIAPLEALQLAEAAVILSGATGGSTTTVDFLRQNLGLDVLRLESGAEQDEAVATAGQYLSEDIFVGLRQGTAPGSTQATVEVDLYKGLKFEGRAGADAESDNGAMLRWEWNY
ncbi:MAG: translocation/assembly module TamB domain-containing protein [Rhodospirillales bacterium]|nr:translocation/assembly module TamB domain-containing protein [Rhodospirillales bacterium]